MKIAQLYEQISKPLFQGTFYHGTARPNPEIFKTDRVAYFTPNKQEAIEHAMMDASLENDPPYLIVARLNCVKPKVLQPLIMQDLHLTHHKNLLHQLKTDAYDCALGEDTDHISEIAVIDPSKIEIIEIINL